MSSWQQLKITAGRRTEERGGWCLLLWWQAQRRRYQAALQGQQRLLLLLCCMLLSRKALLVDVQRLRHVQLLVCLACLQAMCRWRSKARIICSRPAGVPWQEALQLRLWGGAGRRG